MALNNKGLGFASVFDPISGQLTLLALLTVAVAEEVESVKSVGCPYFEPGPNLDYDEMIQSRSTTISVEMEQFTPESLALMGFNQKPSSQTLKVPVPLKLKIPTTGIFTLTGLVKDQDVAITQVNASGLKYFKQNKETPGATPTDPPIPAAPPAAGEFVVTADTIAFNADDKDLVVQARYYDQITKLVIGGPSAINAYENVEIYSEYDLTKGGRRAFWVPKATSTSGANITLSAAGDAVSRDFTALVDTERGFQLPYMDWPKA